MPVSIMFLIRTHLPSNFLIKFLLQKRGILERLNAGEIVIGDGGFVFQLEKRGYVKAGPWTPEASVEHPEAGEKTKFRKLS